MEIPNLPKMNPNFVCCRGEVETSGESSNAQRHQRGTHEPGDSVGDVRCWGQYRLISSSIGDSDNTLLLFMVSV